MDIENFIIKRLKLIQKKHNFNPNIGIKQINNQPDLIIDFSIFKEYLNIIKKLDLNIDINSLHKPFGLNKKTLTKTKENQVYFARLESNSSIWKIGYSQAPYKRGKVLQTSNHESITIKYTIPGSRELEQLILKYTIKYKTNGGTEWRSLDNKQIKLIISTIKNCGQNFLSESTLIK